MSTAIKRRRGTSVQHLTFTGLEGEVTIDTNKETAVIHDGSTAGGFTLMREDAANYDGSEINNFRSQSIDDNSTNHTAQLILADGGILIGSPTGGVQGADTINAEGLFVNGGAVAVKSANETITGDWTFTGTVINVNATDLNISDNTISLNNGEAGAGVTAGSAGLLIDRGSETNASFIFDESDDTWKIGILGAEVAIAAGGSLTVGDTSVVVTDTGTDGQIIFTADGTQEAEIDQGLSLGAATGGPQGVGTINAVDFFDDGVNINTIYSPIASPTFTGVPEAPTAAVTTNTTQLATTAFVQQELSAKADVTVGNTSITVADTGSDGSVTFATEGTTRGLFDAAGNFVLGNAQIADAATDGFLYITNTTSGAPSGSPTSYSGRTPLVYDDTNSTLYAHNGSSWEAVGDGDGLAYAIAFS